MIITDKEYHHMSDFCKGTPDTNISDIEAEGGKNFRFSDRLLN